jgi:hypothetical protein
MPLLWCPCTGRKGDRREADQVPALTESAPGLPDGLPYFILRCRSCGREFPDLTLARLALKSGWLARRVSAVALATTADVHEEFQRFMRGE